MQRLIAQGVLLKKVRSKNQTKMIIPSQMTEFRDRDHDEKKQNYDDDEHRCGVGGYGGSSWF